MSETANEEEGSLRDDLEAAIAQHEEAAPEPAAQEAAPATPEPEAQEAAPEQTEPVAQEAVQHEIPLSETEVDVGGRYEGITDEHLGAAPAGWVPAARETWANLPEQAKREIHKREADIARGMQEASEARKFMQDIYKVSEPYKAIMAADGADDPRQAFEGLLRSAAGLRMGTPAQKAAHVARIVDHYGVDIGELDSALAGTPPQDGPDGGGQLPSALEQRLSQMEGFMQNLTGTLEQTAAQRHAQEVRKVQEFGKSHEFFEDVREEMADIWEVNSNRGRTITLEDAYNLAIQMNPGVQQALAQRKEVQGAAAQQESMARKLAASGASRPPSNSMAPPAPQASNGSLRGDIEAAISLLEER